MVRSQIDQENHQDQQVARPQQQLVLAMIVEIWVLAMPRHQTQVELV